MKLSRRARYALRMMLTIARYSGPDERVSLKQVADKTKISRRYMEQLAIALKNSDLIVGITGKGGGYRLSRPAPEIKLTDIVTAAIGPIEIVECLDHADSCLQAAGCECRELYQQINDRITDLLNEYTLADLANKKIKAALPKT